MTNKKDINQKLVNKGCIQQPRHANTICVSYLPAIVPLMAKLCECLRTSQEYAFRLRRTLTNISFSVHTSKPLDDKRLSTRQIMFNFFHYSRLHRILTNKTHFVINYKNWYFPGKKALQFKNQCANKMALCNSTIKNRKQLIIIIIDTVIFGYLEVRSCR